MNMKKSILAIAAAAMFVMSACTEEKDIDLVAALNAEYEFDVTGSGAFQESGTFSTSDLADISSNIDEDGD